MLFKQFHQNLSKRTMTVKRGLDTYLDLVTFKQQISLKSVESTFISNDSRFAVQL